MIASIATPVRLGPTPITVELEPEPPFGKVSSLRIQAAHLAEGERIFLLLGNLRIDKQPGVIYALFLDLQDGDLEEQSNAQPVGTLNFYGVTPATTAKPNESRFLSFDVTETVVSLAKRGKLLDKTRITIVPDGSPAVNSHPIIGRLELVRHSG